MHYIAANMGALGVSAGDRVGIWLSNVPEWIEAFFACAYLGATAGSLNTRFGASEVGDIVSRAGCKALLLSSDSKNKNFVSILNQITNDQKKYVPNMYYFIFQIIFLMLVREYQKSIGADT